VQQCVSSRGELPGCGRASRYDCIVIFNDRRSRSVVCGIRLPLVRGGESSRSGKNATVVVAVVVVVAVAAPVAVLALSATLRCQRAGVVERVLTHTQREFVSRDEGRPNAAPEC